MGAVEFVNLAVGSMSLASEAFAQLLKQLTANPSPASLERGWQLMALLLDHTLPSSSLEVDLLAGFIWLNAPKTIRLKLLDMLLQRRKPSRSTKKLDLSEIPARTRSLWVSGGRPSLQLPRGSLKLP